MSNDLLPTRRASWSALIRRPSNTRGLAFKHRDEYFEVAKMGSADIIAHFQTTDTGLTEEEATSRLTQCGPNEVTPERYNWQRQLLKALFNPFIILLSVLALISLATDDFRGAIVMGIMVFISVLLTFFQEHRSNQAAARLKAMVSTNATVVRTPTPEKTEDDDGKPLVSVPKRLELPINTIVPGDFLYLSAGDMIPADMRLLSTKDLFVSQSALTGESVPIEKKAGYDIRPEDDLLELGNVCFVGSNIVSGTATGIVIKTGEETYLGNIAKKIGGPRARTSFDKGIDRFTKLMLRFMVVMVPLVFLLNGFTKGDWFEAFMFAVAVAVGLTPEMLPMIVTVNLAKGALAMSKKKVIVKRLNSIQNFGAMDVLCTDKTGTLTQDKVILERYVDAVGNDNRRVLRYAYLNSFYQTGLKSLIDVAILDHKEIDSELEVRQRYRKLDEIPFDFSRRRMSVVVEKDNARHILVSKGAIEEIFKVCTHAEINRQTVPLTPETEEEFSRVAQAYNDDGLRVLAIAYKDVPKEKTDYSVKDECDLTLLGYVALLDPPKDSAREAIEALNATGVSVKVLTGDNERVTRKICREVGINVDQILLGHQLERMTDFELDRHVEDIAVFAKLTPSQKERIVTSLHRRGRVVGFMGDGINDAPALKSADVGISVDNAVDVAKESADIILLEKSLLVLVQGVIEGRKVFGNIVKYIKMGASSNFGNVFSVLGASAFLPFLPMLPVQLLSQNLLYDLSQVAIPLDNVDPEYLEKPRKWEIGDIGRFMLIFGPISSLFDYVTFFVMWYVFKANIPEKQSLFQSGWFVEGLLTQTLVVHMIRTKRIPFLESRAATPMIVLTLIIMCIGIYLPFSRYGSDMSLSPLPPSYFFWLFGILISYCTLTQLVKNWFIKKYGYN